MSRGWDESEHPRWPAGTPGDKDGQFRPKAGAGRKDLASLSRSTLLKYARERGLAIPRGHPDDAIRQMIRRFDSGTEPGWIAEVGKRIEAKKAPAKKTPAKTPAKKAPPAKKVAPGPDLAKLEAKIENLRGRLGLAREKRKRGAKQGLRSQAEVRLEGQLREAKIELDRAKRETPATPIALPGAPTTTLAADEQARIRQLIRRDPQIYATVRDRYGRVSTSGNLSVEDAAWLERMTRRDRAFVEYIAQTATIDRDIRRRAKDADQTPAQYRAAVAARLKELLDDKPIAVRVRDEIALRDILDGGRFKTSHEGARRAAGLGTDVERRRLGEQIQGVPTDTPYERRPIYGYVAVSGIEPALSAGVQTPGIRQREGQEDVLSAYGQVQVVLKPEVRARTTATVGDSLDDLAFIRPTPVDSPGAESVGSNLDWLFRPDFSRTGYVEAQVHGGVRAEDIAEVVFPSQPANSTIAALDRRDIPWRVLPPGGATAVWAQRVSERIG